MDIAVKYNAVTIGHTDEKATIVEFSATGIIDKLLENNGAVYVLFKDKQDRFITIDEKTGKWITVPGHNKPTVSTRLNRIILKTKAPSYENHYALSGHTGYISKRNGKTFK